MDLNRVDFRKGTGLIKFATDEELEMVSESLSKLIEKAQNSRDVQRGDPEEVKRLEKFKNTKIVTVDKSKERKVKLDELKEKAKKRIEGRPPPRPDVPGSDADVRELDDYSFADPGSEISKRELYAIIEALNEHISEMENDGSFRTEKQKYKKLQKLLDDAQLNKERFQRERPKPRGFGRLRK